jgi:hypothetical protein
MIVDAVSSLVYTDLVSPRCGHQRTNELETEMLLENDYPVRDYDLYAPRPTEEGYRQAQEVADWRIAAVSKFADLIEKSFREEHPHIVTNAKFDRDTLVAYLYDALGDAIYEIKSELEGE